jgi:hypothetical protein
MMMTPTQFIKWCVILNIHVLPGLLSVTERIGYTMNGAAFLDLAGTTEGCNTTRFVVIRCTFGTVHLDLLPQQASILLNLFCKSYSIMLKTTPILIKLGIRKGWFGELLLLSIGYCSCCCWRFGTSGRTRLGSGT